MLLLLLVVVVASGLSELRHNSAARMTAHTVTLACSWHRRRRSKAYRTCLMDCWHHEMSEGVSCLLHFFLVVKLTDSRLHSMYSVMLLLCIVVSSIKGCRLRHLSSIVSCRLWFPLVLVLTSLLLNSFVEVLRVSFYTSSRSHVMKMLGLLAWVQILASSTVLEMVGLTFVPCTVLSTFVHSVLSWHREGRIVSVVGVVLASSSHCRMVFFI